MLHNRHLLNPDFIPLTIFMVLAIMGAILGLLLRLDELDDDDEGMLTGRGRETMGAPTAPAVPWRACARTTLGGGLALRPTYASLVLPTRYHTR